MSKSNVFPIRTSDTTKASKVAAAPKKRRATRGNIVPATPFVTGGKVVHGGAAGPVEAWPDTPSDVFYYPNALARSAVFGGTRTTRSKSVKATPTEDRNMKTVGTLVEYKAAASTSQYEISYKGEVLNQQDAEVWMMVLATARRAGLAGEQIEFTLNDWCRALGRPENDWFANQAILASLERFKTATLKVYNRDTRRRDWFSMIVHMAEQDGRYTYTIDHRVAAMCRDDCTQIDVVRKSALKSLIAKWMHDFFSTSSNAFTWKLSMLRELSGCTHMEPGKFRNALREAVEELKCIKSKDGTEFPPVFAPETQIETQVRDGKPCEVLVMVKATNSLVLEPRKGAEMLEMLTATAMRTPVEAIAPVVPTTVEVQQAPAPAAHVTKLATARHQARKVTKAVDDDYVPIWDRNIDPSDTRSSAERKYAWLRARDREEAAIYAQA
ncbi:plasmid replication initiator TrfA [Burkholderia glumae]|uniref:plasmid replication initiator TrfA n=1 Tax=Burkholderia glumae TaxID=337 RepID=UPI00214FD0E7|nr:plasmid replication initiator TrfA [Burkholderia glumae]